MPAFILLGVFGAFILWTPFKPPSIEHNIDAGAPILIVLILLGAIIGLICGIVLCAVFWKKAFKDVPI